MMVATLLYHHQGVRLTPEQLRANKWLAVLLDDRTLVRGTRSREYVWKALGHGRLLERLLRGVKIALPNESNRSV